MDPHGPSEREYRVHLKRNEYTGMEPGPDIWVNTTARLKDALDYVKNSGYVMELAGWTNGRAKWQACYRIERIGGKS